MGCSHLNKTSLNIPIIHSDTFKIHEKEVGTAVREVLKVAKMLR